MQFTNNSRARQGIAQEDGSLVFLDPGETKNISPAEHALEKAKRLRFWGIEGVERPPEKQTLQQLNDGIVAERQENQDNAGLQDELARLNEELMTSTAQLAQATNELGEARQELEKANGAVTDALAERDAAIADRDAAQALLNEATEKMKGMVQANDTTHEDPTKLGLVAKHRGGGSYSVMSSDDKDAEELVVKLTKEQTDAFNAMNDVEKTKFVRDAQAA